RSKRGSDTRVRRWTRARCGCDSFKSTITRMAAGATMCTSGSGSSSSTDGRATRGWARCATATSRSCRCPCTSSAAGSRSSSRWRAVSRPTTSARIWPAGPQSVRRSPSWAARSRACAPDPGSGDETAPRPQRAAAGRTHLTGRVPGGSLAGGLRECREQVRVLVQPGLDGLGLAALAVLVDDHVLELAVLLVADLDVARELGDVRVVLGEALAGQDVEA